MGTCPNTNKSRWFSQTLFFVVTNLFLPCLFLLRVPNVFCMVPWQEGCCCWDVLCGFSPHVHAELVLLTVVRGFHGRSEKAVLPLLLYCFISLAILGTPAGLSFGKYFFSPLNM